MLLAGIRSWFAAPPAPALMMAEAEQEEAPLEAGASTSGTAWPAKRIALAGRLWGEGYVLPGGEDETLRLARPLGLSAASSLLLLGCGPGGASCSIAGRLEVWVSGFEADPDLAEAGALLCSRSGLGKRARVSLWNPDRPEFQHHYYHHALGLEPMRVSPPETVLAGVALALRPGGQLALLEAAAGEKANGPSADFTRWMELEGRTAPPSEEAAITRALGRLGFEVRVAEDVSGRHTAQVVQGWREIVRALEQHRPEPRAAAMLVREGELWLLRARLLRAGRLRLVRWHAIGRRGGAE